MEFIRFIVVFVVGFLVIYGFNSFIRDLIFYFKMKKLRNKK